MYEELIKARNKILRSAYKYVCKPIFFRCDAENVHEHMLKVGTFLGAHVLTRKIMWFLFHYENNILEQTVAGITFKNPIGLAAGFDKNAQLVQILPEIGFGFIEVGSITAQPCPGNPKPRLWRLPKSQSLIVYYGLKNEGAQKIQQRLQKMQPKIPIGISIAKTNCAATADTNEGIKDYTTGCKIMQEMGEYMTINISCPNSFGGQPFTDAQKLEQLLKEVKKIKYQKPIFIKLSPDIETTTLDALIKIIQKYNIAGVICANLTKERNNEKIKEKNIPEQGGLSGKVVEQKANEQIHYIYQKTKGKIIIIGCGGIFSAQDAYEKLQCGATVLQLITGMIYEGPQVISEINQGLVQLLKKDGYKNISQAKGTKTTGFL